MFFQLSGWAVVWYVLGICLLVGGVLCAAWVVRPRLRAANLATEAPVNFIYFGHLRHLTPDDVHNHLKTSDVLPVLSKQLVEMSKIAWTKHRLVQLSMSLAPLGVIALGISATY
ncbi:Pycsar system effector family protein [Rhodococcus indonesiensis]